MRLTVKRNDSFDKGCYLSDQQTGIPKHQRVSLYGRIGLIKQFVLGLKTLTSLIHQFTYKQLTHKKNVNQIGNVKCLTVTESLPSIINLSALRRLRSTGTIPMTPYVVDVPIVSEYPPHATKHGSN
jgi:hypothetical protein